MGSEPTDTDVMSVFSGRIPSGYRSVKSRLITIPDRKTTRPLRFKTGVQLYGDLPRKQLANLIRLRTGHCRLNSYLNRHNIIEDPSCECGRGIETVKHFLLHCKKYEEERKELKKAVKERNMRLENLLGDPKLVRHMLEYVEKTGRFNFV